MFSYDAVGSSERVRAACTGRGAQLIQPLLDDITGLEEDPALWELMEGGGLMFGPALESDPGADSVVPDESASAAVSNAAETGLAGTEHTVFDKKGWGLRPPHFSIPRPSSASSARSARSARSRESRGSTSNRRCCVELSCDAACAAVERAFRAAAEREITVGDGVDIWIVRDGGGSDAAIANSAMSSASTTADCRSDINGRDARTDGRTDDIGLFDGSRNEVDAAARLSSLARSKSNTGCSPGIPDKSNFDSPLIESELCTSESEHSIGSASPSSRQTIRNASQLTPALRGRRFTVEKRYISLPQH